MSNAVKFIQVNIELEEEEKDVLCDRCGKEYSQKAMCFQRPEDKENVCIWCAGVYMGCDICGEWYHIDDLELDEDKGIWVCFHCNEKQGIQ